MNNPILVTGCAGLIGARVARLLVDQGHEVVGIDNMNGYYNISLKQYRLDQLKAPGFQFKELDLENRDDVTRLFDMHRFSAVLNLAARAGVRYSMVNPHVYLTTNVMGNLNLLEELRKRDIKKYVLASTSSLYAGQEMPFKEEGSGLAPLSPYAASKKSAELMAYSYHHLYGIDVSICRYFTVYGPAGRPDMAVFRFIKWIDEGQPIQVFGDGSQARDFTHVDDIAAGTVAALKPLGYEIINLGGGNQPVSVSSLINMLESLIGKKAILEHLPSHKADMKTTWADISKAKELLDWSPLVRLEDGLAECVKWHFENKPWSGSIELQSTSELT